jgi:hypothetical protein
MSVRIRVHGDEVHVSRAEAPLDRMPYLTALVEAAGALLHWDATETVALPDADVDDLRAAADWLPEIYGQEVADAVVFGADATLPVGGGDPAVIDAVLRLGHLNWAQAWWPAGARISALDPALLAAESAVTAHIVEHLLDDDRAVERVLADAAEAPRAVAALPPAFAAETERLLTTLADLSEDHGVALAPAEPAAVREDWALAAGGVDSISSGVEVASGRAAVRWSDVPAQTVDAGAEARWAIRQRAGAAVLRVEVPAVDSPRAARSLTARFGPAELGVDVVLRRETTLFEGEAEVPASALFLPSSEQTLWVRDPVLSPEDDGAPDPHDARERVLSFAAARLLSPKATLAERSAGVRR